MNSLRVEIERLFGLGMNARRECGALETFMTLREASCGRRSSGRALDRQRMGEGRDIARLPPRGGGGDSCRRYIYVSSIAILIRLRRLGGVRTGGLCDSHSVNGNQVATPMLLMQRWVRLRVSLDGARRLGELQWEGDGKGSDNTAASMALTAIAHHSNHSAFFKYQLSEIHDNR